MWKFGYYVIGSWTWVNVSECSSYFWAIKSSWTWVNYSHILSKWTWVNLVHIFRELSHLCLYPHLLSHYFLSVFRALWICTVDIIFLSNAEQNPDFFSKSIYLFHGQTHNPHHFSIPVMCLLASFISALILSMLDSTLSNCSLRKLENTQVNHLKSSLK